MQFIDDGLYYGDLPHFVGDETPLDLLQSEDSDFSEAGLEFSDKPNAVGFVKEKGL